MDIQVTALGALIGLAVAIVMILRKILPVYALLTGAVLGGLIGGASMTETVDLMIEGVGDIASAILRILAAGVLAGILIESGGATVIAKKIVGWVGHARALLALALATMLLTGVGVFIDIAVITVAPIALVIAREANLSRMAILLAMIGGGKAGNIMSPNPNNIAVADAFGVPLTSVMAAGILPAIFGIAVTYLLAKRLSVKGTMPINDETELAAENHSIRFSAALVAPLTAIVLLALRPLFGIEIDPMVALPLGGLLGALAMGQLTKALPYMVAGLNKMAPIAVLLIGTGAIAGIISNSSVSVVLVDSLEALGLPSFALAPASGIFMGAATASTTAGAAVASTVFSSTLLELGVSALAGAAMVSAGATVVDHLPHGSFFHATAGSVNMDIQERLKLMPYESAVGLVLAFISTLIFGIFQWFG
ncbi:GntP family permease [Shouchella shacheensis]|uniref:GntP family permease n=1 Tax=Shouchella shacheensis TaxID=1649580 RepID=UPI00073FB7EF|nr:SLC13 family permease [Shouchella shacheensis]